VGKLVRCIRGNILDVVVDIRKKSPTYGKWAGIELSDEGNRMFWVPEGFAHGFLYSERRGRRPYKVSGYWAPEVDRGLLWNDPAVGIRWPTLDILVSAKDAKLPPLASRITTSNWGQTPKGIRGLTRK